jgi:ABC-type sulfate/molybdate transport systems ATPase subunit
MVELELTARRGSFRLEINCRLSALWTVVFGPSGAGKSTLLRLIAGLETPDQGRISIHGEYVLDTEIGLNRKPGQFPRQRRVGLVAQEPALFPHLSAYANVAYGLPGMSRLATWQRVSAMLELVGAEELANRSPRALSGGEAQRVALARALAPMPKLLLLDEPLSALDASARDQILARLQNWLKEQRIQTILVTHDAADALATEAEVVLIGEGKLMALGPAREVLAAERQRLLTRLGAHKHLEATETNSSKSDLPTPPAPVKRKPRKKVVKPG